MNPFEDLIHALGAVMDIPLRADNHQSCLITFKDDEVALQIDLDTNKDLLFQHGKRNGPAMGAN